MSSSDSQWVRSADSGVTRPCGVCGVQTSFCHKLAVRWKEAGAELGTWLREWRCTNHAPRLYAYLQAQTKEAE